MAVRIRRIYEPSTPDDGDRVLIDGLWPRGVAKADAQLDDWLRELAPSAELRRWFDHDPGRFDEFRRRYLAELDERTEAVGALVARARRGDLTLLYAARDEQHNNAVVLRDLIEERLG